MVSVMAIESEVFGRCVEEIFVSVVVKYGDAWLCCGWKYLRLFWGGLMASMMAICSEVLVGVLRGSMYQ